MIQKQTKTPRAPVGAAQDGSPRARELRSPVLQLDLKSEVEDLRRQESYKRAGRLAKTLTKYTNFRIILTVIRAGTRIQTHTADGRVSTQSLDGHLRLHAFEKVVDMPTGHLLVLDYEMSHDVEALTDSAFLVTIAWPAEHQS